jgi:phage tail sheath protein FI
VLQLTYPGVYTQELPSGVRTVTGAPTSVALFVGPTRTGIDGRAIRCMNFGDFERQFGGLYATSSLSFSVLHFFAGGGGEAHIVRVPVANAKPATSTIKQADAAAASLTLTALSSGAASNAVLVEIDRSDISPVAAAERPRRFGLTVIDSVTGRVERFSDLTTATGDVRSANTVVNDPTTGSSLVELTLAGAGLTAPQDTGTVYTITTPPAAGTFGATPVKVLLSVLRRKATGEPDDALSVRDLEVTVFAPQSARPTSPRELVTKLVDAVNAALRADPAAPAKLGGAAVEGTVDAGGTQLRLRVSRPAGPVDPSARFHDAVITLADPALANAGDPPHLLGTYGIAVDKPVANSAAYLLGAAYQAANPALAAQVAEPQVTAATAGDPGAPDGQPASDAFKAAVTALDDRDPFFNLLCLPDIVRPKASDPRAAHHPNVAAVYAEGARVCANKFAFLIVDPPPDVVDVGSAEAWKSTRMGFASSHAGAWFPNIRVDNPLAPGAIIAHPPSGAVAGVIARTDARVGVWQAPAGTEATIAGAYGPAAELSDKEQGILNPLGLNVIRKFPIYQTVGFGSRTVDGSNALASEWKYIPVRRTANHILRSLSEALRWAVHKGNGEDLWTQLRVSCTGFMQGLYRQGAFKGTSPREAYFVACDASTTTNADMDLGVVNIVIGFSPLKPAEFVVITLRQIVQPAT